MSEIINEAAVLLAPQASVPPQPEDTPPTKIRRLQKLRVSPATAWKKRHASRLNKLARRMENIRDSLSSYTTWQAILAQSANYEGRRQERLVTAAVQVWRKTDGVVLRHIYDAIERYSGLSPETVNAVLDHIDAETHHERIWNSLRKLLPEGEELTQENIETASEAFAVKYPEVGSEDVLEAVHRFGDLGEDESVAPHRPR